MEDKIKFEKSRNRGRIAFVFVLTMVLGLLTGCEKKDHNERYEGSWHFKVVEKYQPSFTELASNTTDYDGQVYLGDAGYVLLHLREHWMPEYTLATDGSIGPSDPLLGFETTFIGGFENAKILALEIYERDLSDGSMYRITEINGSRK